MKAMLAKTKVGDSVTTSSSQQAGFTGNKKNFIPTKKKEEK